MNRNLKIGLCILTSIILPFVLFIYVGLVYAIGNAFMSVDFHTNTSFFDTHYDGLFSERVILYILRTISLISYTIEYLGEYFYYYSFTIPMIYIIVVMMTILLYILTQTSHIKSSLTNNL